MSDLRTALQKEGGCGLLILAAGALMFGGFIYGLIFGFGNPGNKKLFDECYRQHTRRGDITDFERRSALAECTNEQNERLGLPNTHIRAIN